MAEVAELDYILADCFLAAGQAIGTNKVLDFEVVTWWHDRYRQAFDHAINSSGASWTADRDRVTAVGRYLGQRAVHHSAGRRVIGRTAAARASEEVERGCQMNAIREESRRTIEAIRPRRHFEAVVNYTETLTRPSPQGGTDARKDT